MFYELIEAIEKANKKDTEPKTKMENLILKYKEESKKYKMLYESELNRELMYLEK